ncbi:uncharacterized protein ASPGLDRAFT_1054274 [Aspergillus glaucus CBS 516.65]|uniref:Uncharacterized protein n=1 Tax=Aspergillus glaucus CBS 516.65 TaxID=1160497 RepID=A0A1L9V5U2_ASPGL|nr:hypothetical protein ASPGLDRAFT_1054274 [Aspergillus glaucus CBS 516.65]OJJ79278.1 hypothetical protein ASPGLDRAFT_1054274 [Aspergillus glaucus CBS 516.65]
MISSTALLTHQPAILLVSTVSNSKVFMTGTRSTSNVLQNTDASQINKHPHLHSLSQQPPLQLSLLKVTLWTGSLLSLMPATPNASGPAGSVERKLNTGNKMDAASIVALLATELASVPFFLHNTLQPRLLKLLQKMLPMLFWKILKQFQHLREKSSSCAKSSAGVRDRSVTRVLAYLQPEHFL